MSAEAQMTPQDRVAQQFMAHKGLPDLQPVEIEQLENQTCWYYIYELPEGDLELEVLWNNTEWLATVTAFTLAG